MKTLAIVSISFLVVLTIAGCSTHKPGAMAMATLQPTATTGPTGTVHFQDQADGSTLVTVDITGLTPDTVHGFHVHQNPSCADMGNAAGGHFNPMNAPHAAPSAVSHHAGDFGNVKADAKGEVHEHFTTYSVTAHAGDLSVLGHSVVLHANPDDLTSQPAGNSGPRVACGVIVEMAGSMQH